MHLLAVNNFHHISVSDYSISLSGAALLDPHRINHCSSRYDQVATSSHTDEPNPVEGDHHATHMLQADALGASFGGVARCASDSGSDAQSGWRAGPLRIARR